MTTTTSNPNRRALPAGLALLLALAGAAASAAPDHYYDGSRKVAITLQTDLVAEFTAPGQRVAPSRADARPAGAAGSLVAGDSLVRIRRVAPGAADIQGAAAAAAAGATPSSPVYRQGAGGAGRLMALPGGVLVKFKPGWTRERVDAWVRARGLSTARPMAWSSQWYLVETAPGIGSLEAANAMAESGEVLSASPNWWMQTSTR